MSSIAECPECEQSTVTAYRVQQTGALIKVCNRCQGVWEPDDDMSWPATTTAEQYLSSRGLSLRWSSLRAVD